MAEQDQTPDYRVDALRAAGFDDAAELLSKLPAGGSAQPAAGAAPEAPEAQETQRAATFAALPAEQQQQAVKHAMGQMLMEKLKAQTNFGRSGGSL